MGCLASGDKCQFGSGGDLSTALRARAEEWLSDQQPRQVCEEQSAFVDDTGLGFTLKHGA